jgi:exonuclease SbcC
LADDWKALIEWCTAQTRACQQQRSTALADRDRVVAERRACYDQLVERVRPMVPDARGRVEHIGQALAAVGATCAAEMAQLQRDRQRLAKTQAAIADLRTDAAVAQKLGHLLRVSGFERWLLEEALADLVARATVRLHDLTSGQYSLAAQDGAFRIIDHHNADEVRDARSLSGGETFLASLSLALALADSSMDTAAVGTAPLESIFLDEGFGTLDPDTLDVVAGTIEELGAAGRMVGVVTHIRELADRMPTRFEVTKGPTGSSVVRVDV